MNRFGYLIKESNPGFIVWDGWHSSIVHSPNTFICRNIVGYGITQEAAKSIVRLFDDTSITKIQISCEWVETRDSNGRVQIYK